MAKGSLLLVEEYFEKGDPAFVGEFLRARQGGRKLRRFVRRWCRDTRPFAREAILRFADSGQSEGNGRLLVKMLFKHAEQAGDDAAVAHFMVAFDRLLAREAREVMRYDWSRRENVPEWRRVLLPTTSGFSFATRAYLARRAYRYFRRLGARDPDRFVDAVVHALLLYTDAHFPRPDAILDCRSLCMILYGSSPFLHRQSRVIQLMPGCRLDEVQLAPHFAITWRTGRGFRALLTVARDAQSSFVRAAAIQWLRREHQSRLDQLTLQELRPLLFAPHEELLTLAADLMEHVSGWQKLSVAEWLEFLALESPYVLTRVARLFEQHVAPARLSFAQCVELAKSRVAAVAELGLSWARQKGLHGEEELALVASLGDAEVDGVRAGALAWLAEPLAQRPSSLVVRDLVDSRHRDTRSAALRLVQSEPGYKRDARLHAALAESPYGDVEEVLSANLSAWEKDLPSDSAQHAVATLLLNVRRGGRAKRRVLRFLAEALARDPSRAPQVLPLLAVLLRSVREPERRAALAALARAAHSEPSLRAAIEAAVPELSFEEARG